jgi:hypothetical protein
LVCFYLKQWKRYKFTYKEYSYRIN